MVFQPSGNHPKRLMFFQQSGSFGLETYVVIISKSIVPDDLMAGLQKLLHKVKPDKARRARHKNLRSNRFYPYCLAIIRA